MSGNAERIREIPEQVELIKKYLEVLHAHITDLDGRLAPALRMVATAEGDTSEPRKSLVPLAEELRDQCVDSAYSAAERLHSILERLEL